jgi:hypothetical protein
MKRGTEDLDFFIGDEALAAANGPGYGIHYPIRHGQVENWVWNLHWDCSQMLIVIGSYGKILVELHIQISSSRARRPLLPPYRTSKLLRSFSFYTSTFLTDRLASQSA